MSAFAYHQLKELHSAADTALLIDISLMLFQRIHSNGKLVADGMVILSGQHMPQYFLLSLGECVFYYELMKI